MDELKLLVDMVASLPAMAVWVIAFFFVYKVVVIGSVYGLIRFGIDKMHSWLTNPKRQDVTMMIEGECITGTKDMLVAQLLRIKRATGMYIHGSDVQWLRNAIDEKMAADAQKKQPSSP